MSNSKFFAGLDVGGSTIKGLLLDGNRQQVGPPVEVSSNGTKGYLATFEQLKVALAGLCSQSNLELADVKAVGLDVPVPCSNGVVWGKSNLTDDWVGTNIEAEFSKAIQKPVVMVNDANAGALGEWVLRPDHDGALLFVAPGTGLGGGFVLPGGHLYQGANGLALEVGAMCVPDRDSEGNLPSCAGKGDGSCEAWVSLVALRRELAVALSKPENASHQLNQSDESIEAKAFRLRDLASEGDQLSLDLFQQQAAILGHMLADQASELDPGLIVIGGGLAEASFRDWWMDEVKKGFESRVPPFYVKSPIPPHQPTTVFEWAIGGDNSAAVGVAHKAMALVG